MNNKTNHTAHISEDDMRKWTEYLATGKVHDKNHKKQLERLSKREVSLGDVTTIIDFMSRRNDGYISSLIEQNAINEKLLNALGVTKKMREKAKKEYEKELADIQKEIEKAKEELMKTMKKKNEEKADTDKKVTDDKKVKKNKK